AGQALPRRQEAAKAGFLGDDGPAGCEVTDTTVTKPAATGRDVTTLGDAEFGLGTLNEPLVAGRCGRHLGRIEQAPAVLHQSRQVLFFVAMNGQRQQELLWSLSRECNEWAQGLSLL